MQEVRCEWADASSRSHRQVAEAAGGSGGTVVQVAVLTKLAGLTYCSDAMAADEGWCSGRQCSFPQLALICRAGGAEGRMLPTHGGAVYYKGPEAGPGPGLERCTLYSDKASSQLEHW